MNHDEHSKITHRYFCPKGYKEKISDKNEDKPILTDNSLKRFHEDLEKWNKELKEYAIHFKNYYSWNCATNLIYSRFSDNQLKSGRFIDHDEIDIIESNWIEKCYNAGLMSCVPQTCESYGYDFNFCYPKAMTSKNLLIPTKKGKETHLKLDELPKKLKVGYYHVKISSNDKNFKKAFSISKDNVYCQISLKWILKHQHKFNINIDENIDAYLYEDEDCITGYQLFNSWYQKLKEMRKTLPKNKILKHIGSSLWGSLSASNLKTCTNKDINDKKYDDYILHDHRIESNKNEYYVLIKENKPYKYNIRLKPFITAFVRNKVSKLIMEDIDNVIRVHTDGVVFNKKMDHVLEKYKDLKKEDKTTGLIKWKNIRIYDFAQTHQLSP